MVSCTTCLDTVQAKKINTDDLGRAKAFRLFSIARPYMRSFHASWFTFFTAFLSWFAIQPLLPTISKELHLTKKEVANSGIASVSATIFIRILIGPLCDRFGARRTMAGLLVVGSIPLAFTGLISNAAGLIVIRLFVSILGGTFVPCQFWTTSMFSPKVVGTANAIVGGWGNLGGGATFLLMPGLFELCKVAGAEQFLAWKIAVAIPSIFTILIGISIIFTTDDCPQGHWTKRIIAEKIKATTADETAENNDDSTCLSSKFWRYYGVFVLFFQYGMCFGIELAVNNVMNLYLLYNFKKEGCNEELADTQNGTFSNATTAAPSKDVSYECSILNQTTASLIASLFGLMNLFARCLGGVTSDIFRKYFDLPGRILVHLVCLTMVGVMMIVFSRMTTIPSAIVTLIIFSLFVQMSEGSTYAIVPYVWPRRIGIVAGLVGAGGNTGAVVWNSIWSQLVDTNPNKWFWLLGIIIICGSMFSMTIVVQNVSIWHLFTARAMKRYRATETAKTAEAAKSAEAAERNGSTRKVSNGVDNPTFSMHL